MKAYSKEEVERILAAYRSLIPSITPELRRYWDFDGVEDWSGLVTDFTEIGFAELQEFQGGYEDLTASARTQIELGSALRAYALSKKVGFSIGISPWTDDLLLETYQPGVRDLVIVLGHDWYPIACDRYHALPPLTRTSAREEYPLALGAVPPGVAVLFLNLYPHFRAPGADCTGRIKGANYKACVTGFRALCDTVSASGHRINGLITWGLPVWEELGWGVQHRWRIGINAAWRQAANEGLTLSLGGQMVPYHPFLHPSALRPRFDEPDHLAAYRRTWAALLESAPAFQPSHP